MSVASPPALGLTVALAQQALTRRLHAVLADLEIEPALYYVLRVVSTRGPLSSSALDWQLAQAPVPPQAAADAPVTLMAGGLIALDGDMVALTAAGTAMLDRLGAPIAALTRELLAPLDPDDLATTVRTLQAATARADALVG
jgi:hypothetical protein